MVEKVGDNRDQKLAEALAGWHEAIAQAIQLEEKIAALTAEKWELCRQLTEARQQLDVERDRQRPNRFRVRESNRDGRNQG